MNWLAAIFVAAIFILSAAFITALSGGSTLVAWSLFAAGGALVSLATLFAEGY